MTIQERQDEIIDEFSVYDDWMEKYEYIIDLGKELPLIAPDKKTDDRLISGCQSQVWLEAEVNDGKLQFTADSDAIITKGVIGLLVRVMNNATPEEILKTDLYFIDEIGLKEHLLPTRANGLLSMVNKIKMLALANLKNVKQ